jgi:mediator of RNA polymerase II transcription subunit 12, fungi type
VRLAARLFFEHLLDQDCYLDWYMSSMETSTLDVFPMWLAMLSIYWENLVRFRKRGRRLSEALLEKLREAMFSEYKAHLQPLIDRVSVIVQRLCHKHSACVIIPRSWDRYQDVISTLFASDDSRKKAIYQSLVLRNARVQRPRTSIPTSQRSPQQQIIKFLDSSRDVYNIGALSHACLSIMPNRGELVSVLLKWTASPFRQGLIRVYIAVRLLREWKRSGMDIDAFIFSFLTQASVGQTAPMVNIYHVIVELIRSQTFSVGRYLQWLVARGAVEQYRQESSPNSHVPVDIDLLSHIPISRLPRHLRNLRDTLMARAGGLLSSQTEVVQGIKDDLKRRLPQVLRADDIKNHKMAIDVERNNLTWSIKADISQWIRAAVSEHYKYGSRYQQKIYHHRRSIEVSSLTPDEFLIIRSTLEQYGDLSMLADILINASNSNDTQLLMCAVDTLNCHFDCFTVIGALNDLFRNFYEAFLRVKNNTQPVYDLAYSLCEVARRLPYGVNPLIVLRQELSRGDRNLALAACSPVSDHVAETLNDTNPSFNEDMDHFLSSGNSMDETTMIVVFQKLIQQLVLYDEKDASMPGTVCRHLAQLRSFNPKHFDLLLVQWLEAALKTAPRPKFSRTLRPLVGIGCVTLPAFAVLVKKILVPDLLNPTVPEPLELLIGLLELLIPDHNLQPTCDFLSYRFRIAQEEFLCEHSHEVLGVIQDTVFHLAQSQAADLLNDQKPMVTYMVPLLREIILRHPEDTTLDSVRTLVKEYPEFGPVVRKAIDTLLNDNNQSNLDFLSEAATTINKTDNLSLPLCQMKLQILFNEKQSDDIKNKIVDLMYKSAIADVRAGHTYWLDLVSTMGQDAAEQVS